MARPDRPRKTQLRRDRLASGCACRVASTNAASTGTITSVRISVAKSLLTRSTPSFPRMAVRAANRAESRAQPCHGSVFNMI